MSIVSLVLSSLLISNTLRSSSSSSYAASLLFMVDLRLVLCTLEEGRPFCFPFGDRVPSLEKDAAREVVRDRFWYIGR